MRLLTAHKILIACGLAMFILYGTLSAARAWRGEPGAAMGLLVSLIALFSLGFYFRWLRRRR
jgi:hypothetical protein